LVPSVTDQLALVMVTACVTFVWFTTVPQITSPGSGTPGGVAATARIRKTMVSTDHRQHRKAAFAKNRVSVIV
jgi:hypothetical protein